MYRRDKLGDHPSHRPRSGSTGSWRNCLDQRCYRQHGNRRSKRCETKGVTRPTISPAALYNAQRNDHNLKQVIQYLENSKEKPPLRDRLGESKTARRLMNEWRKLELGEDGILRRRAGEYLQWVYVCMYVKLYLLTLALSTK